MRTLRKTFCFCRVRVCPRIYPVDRLITAIPAPIHSPVTDNCPTRNKKFLSGLDKVISIRYNRYVRRRSLVVKPQLPKLEMRVRFPSPAPKKAMPPNRAALLFLRRVRTRPPENVKNIPQRFRTAGNFPFCPANAGGSRQGNCRRTQRARGSDSRRAAPEKQCRVGRRHCFFCGG